jgi:hypothetical protein
MVDMRFTLFVERAMPAIKRFAGMARSKVFIFQGQPVAANQNKKSTQGPLFYLLRDNSTYLTMAFSSPLA